MRGTCVSGLSRVWHRGVGRTGCDARRARGDYETRMEGGRAAKWWGEWRAGEGRGRKGSMNERSIDI